MSKNNLKHHLLSLIATVFWGLAIIILSACAGVETRPVYHTFAIEVGDGVAPVKNLRYLYGDIGWRESRSASPLGGHSALTGVMIIPEDFEISWESEAGQHYTFKVPVRSKLLSSVKHKTVQFVIMGDRVEGYIGTRPRQGIGPLELERFY
jgi:hypothetical protein